MTLNELKEQRDKLKNKQSELKGQLSLLKENRDLDKKSLKKHKNTIKVCAKASKVMSAIQKTSKQKVKKSIENLVTYALKYIHEKNHKFKLNFSQRGSLTELTFDIQDEEFKESHQLETSCAGGILNIVATALRVIFLELSKIKGPIVFDETFRNLSRNYLNNASNFLSYVNEKTGRQIIMITHKSDFINNADTTITLQELETI